MKNKWLSGASLLALGLLVGCGGFPVRPAGTVEVQVNLGSGIWYSPAESSRFLTPDSPAVSIEVKSEGPEGYLYGNVDLPVQVDTQGVASATGSLDKLPTGIPLVLLASIFGESGEVVSQGDSSFIIPLEGLVEVKLTLLPTENHPGLQTLLPGSNPLTIPGGTSRILRFQNDSPESTLVWNISAWPDLVFQVRNDLGAAAPWESFGTSPEDGILLNTIPSRDTYVVVYNKGVTPVETDFQLEPVWRFVAVGASGQAWQHVSGTTWTGPYATGLALVNDMTYANGLYVAAGQTSSNSYGITTSQDGITWEALTLGGTNAQILRLSSNPEGHIVALGYYGATVETFFSTNGRTWMGPSVTGIAGGGVGPAWDGTAWYLANGNLSAFRKSADGQTWSSASGTSGMYSPRTMIGFSGRLFVGGGAPGSTNKQFVVSTNGALSFSPLTNIGTATDYVERFAADPGTNTLLAVGGGASEQVLVTTDFGTTWTPVSNTGTATYAGAWHCSAGFLVGDSVGYVYLTDGSTLTPLGRAGTEPVRALAYSRL